MTPDDGQGPDHDDSSLARSPALFFELSLALALSEAENGALLGLTADALEALRTGTPPAVGQSKLQRRLDYAIPILQRMIAAIAP